MWVSEISWGFGERSHKAGRRERRREPSWIESQRAVNGVEDFSCMADKTKPSVQGEWLCEKISRLWGKVLPNLQSDDVRGSGQRLEVLSHLCCIFDFEKWTRTCVTKKRGQLVSAKVIKTPTWLGNDEGKHLRYWRISCFSASCVFTRLCDGCEAEEPGVVHFRKILSLACSVQCYTVLYTTKATRPEVDHQF